jgi:hypothetical protein
MTQAGPALVRATRILNVWKDRIRHRAQTVVGQYPRLYLPLARWQRDRRLEHDRRAGVEARTAGPVERDTDVVIEGFPRSANTFAVIAFELAQPNAIRIAHHLHVPSQVIAAAQWGIPSLVLVRDPEEVVLSVVQLWPHISLEQALKDYVRFHRCILPYRERFVVASFEETTTDFGAVIRRLNARFGTSFREFQHTHENLALCYALIERYGGARPSPHRDAMKRELRVAIRSPGLAKVRADAHHVYQTLTSAGAGDS